MTEQLSFYGTMLELRILEEQSARDNVQQGEQQLALIREKIRGLDRANDNIAKAARSAFATPGGDQGRGYLRMKHKLRLDRALANSQLSAAKDQVRELRRALTEAVRCRKDLEKVRGAHTPTPGYYQPELTRNANPAGMVASA